MLDLHRLRLLREFRRRGTITAVAEALSFSPSAVSQQLATLERETGVRLLEPAGRRVRLTPQAELLVTHADVLLEEVERAGSALARSMDEITGTLKLAAFQTAVMALIPSALTRLQGRAPHLRVERLASDGRRFESGTENIAGLAGLRQAVQQVLDHGAETVEKHILERTARKLRRCSSTSGGPRAAHRRNAEIEETILRLDEPANTAPSDVSSGLRPTS